PGQVPIPDRVMFEDQSASVGAPLFRGGTVSEDLAVVVGVATRSGDTEPEHLTTRGGKLGLNLGQTVHDLVVNGLIAGRGGMVRGVFRYLDPPVCDPLVQISGGDALILGAGPVAGVVRDHGDDP